ncbi:MAG TPA: (Fe-S)-binding protein [Candidatus Limnocylindrales bacterium]|nr:(Fe-S)-binding protein [Candidatus Limnocylindrales bacterium]
MKSIAVAVVFLAAVSYFAYRAARLYRILRLGGPDRRFDRPAERIAGVLKYVGAHTRMFRNFYSGLAHFFIFYGFVVLLTAVFEAFLSGIFPGHDLGVIGGHTWLAFLQDLFGVLVLVGVVMALINRVIIRPRQFHDSNERDALIILGLIATIMIGMLGQFATSIARGGDPSAGARPFSSAIARWFEAIGWSGSAATVPHEVFYWIHILGVLAFLVYIPSSKHLHIFVAIPNIYFRNLGPKGALHPLDLEHSEHYGMNKVLDNSWKGLLDLYSCTECGRCQEQCPAFLTGKPLNPKMIIVDSRDNLYRTVRDVPSGQRHSGAPAEEPLIGGAVKEDEIWACVNCGACQEECPVLIEHVPKIDDMRRSLVLEESRFPKEAEGALRSIETQGNPYGLPKAQRADWASGLGVKTVEEKPDAEYLYFVGCAASYDEANKQVARAFVRLLQQAGVDFAILGRTETCNGDPARRIGNEYLYQQQAQRNIESMKAAKVRKVIATCPHCFNTIKNEYPPFGGTFEVVHHTQLLAQLIKDGKLRPQKPIDGKFTYHDSCFLGRWNDIYDPPRAIVEAIPGADLVEIERHRKRGFCCGAGGGRMWMEEKIGKRINHERVEQTLRTEAPRVATACPFCLTMFRDGITAKGAQDRLLVQDLAQYLAQSVDGESPPR